MPTPDLPIELWLKILSYLSEGTASKLIGLSRNLFEIGMNEMYEHVNVGFSIPFLAKRIEKHIEHLKYQSIANRVQRVTISASFSAFRDAASQSPSAPTGSMGKLKSLLGITDENSDENSKQRLSTLALDGLAICQNTHELTLEAQGKDPITPRFTRFLVDLVKTPLGTQIRTLVLHLDLNNWRNTNTTNAGPDVPPDKPSFLVLPIGYFTNLTNLKLILGFSTWTGRVRTDESKSKFAQELREFIASTRDSLTDLTVVMDNAEVDFPFDFAEVFPLLTLEGVDGVSSEGQLGSFPALTHIAVHSEILGFNLVRAERLAEFLTRSAINIQSLTLTHGPLHGMGRQHINAGEERKRRLAKILQELGDRGRPMDSLTELVLSMSQLEIDPLVASFKACIISNLKKIVLLPWESGGLSFNAFKLIFASIVQGGGANALEEVQLCVQSLSPSHLETLQTSLPNLKKLTLRYPYLTVTPDVRAERTGKAIHTAFKEISHPEWQARELSFEQTERDIIFIDLQQVLRGQLYEERSGPIITPRHSVEYFDYDSDDEYLHFV